MPHKHRLFNQFPPVTKEEWLEKIKTDLKGEDFERKLLWDTGAFSVKPFYMKEDTDDLTHQGRLLFRKEGRWRIRQNIDVSGYDKANEKADFLLKNGIDSLGFVISDPDSISFENFRTLLKDIDCSNVELSFLSNGKAREMAEILTNMECAGKPCREVLTGAIEADPLGRLMLNGTLCIPVSGGFDYLAALVNESYPLPGIRVVQVNGSNFANAGASCTTELAFSISMACEYLNQLTDRGINPGTAIGKIIFSFAAGSSFFMEIAKLRAARIVWPAIADKFTQGAEANQSMIIHSVTTRWNKTLYDPYVNLIRTQAEAMAAILGGADTVTVEPFDTVFRRPDEFSERMARNQQLILREEAFFDKVSDPAAGSWYIENLTSLLAENAWKLFVDIEEKGGFLSALKKGIVQKMINREAEKQKSDAVSGRRSILGTNRYPNHGETMLSLVDEGIVFSKPVSVGKPETEPLKISRLAEEFERTRLDLEKAVKQSNQ